MNIITITENTEICLAHETEREDAYRDAVENLLGSHLETNISVAAVQ